VGGFGFEIRRGSPPSDGKKKMALIGGLEDIASHFPSGDQDI